MSKAKSLIGNLKTIFQSNRVREANGVVYFDQLRRFPSMSKDDERAYSTLLDIYFPGANVAWWPRENPEAVQDFLRDWCRNQELELVQVLEYERPSDGYFEWRFNFVIPEGRWD